MGSKDEWRRRKKKLIGDPNAVPKIATVEEVRDIFCKMRGKLSSAEQTELDKIMDAQVQALEAGEVPGPPYSINFKAMAEEARTRVQARTSSEIRAARQFKGAKRATPEEQSVDSYLQFLSFALWTSRQETRPDRRALAMRTYVAMQNARVFHIGPETYIAVHQEADRFTTEMCGLSYEPHTEGPKPSVPEKESRLYLKTFMQEAKRQSYPENLPFPAIFLGYGPGARLPDHTMESKSPSELRTRIEELYILGHLVTDEGYILNCYRGVTRDENDTESYAIWFDEARCPEAGWTRSPGLDLEPWTVPHLIRILNDYRTFVLETEMSGEIRRDIKQHKKQLGLDDYKYMPSPYYRLRLQSKVVQEKVRKQLGQPPRPKTYKTDVRGHERCRIRRGPLPIEPKLAGKLQQYGYKLFTTNTLDEETFQRLSERGLGYKRSDEWLAVKASWIRDHMSSLDPKLPYIPAVRTIGKVRVRPRKTTGGWTEDPAAH
jgi:hypothetical protein